MLPTASPHHPWQFPLSSRGTFKNSLMTGKTIAIDPFLVATADTMVAQAHAPLAECLGVKYS